MKPRVRIEDWYIRRMPSDSEDGGGNGDGTSFVLLGRIQEHPKLNFKIEETQFVRTTRIVRLSKIRNECETRNTIYELGEKAEYHNPPEDFDHTGDVK